MQQKSPAPPASGDNQDTAANDLDRWQDAAKRTPDDPFVLRSLAQAQQENGRDEDARATLRKAEQLSPKDYLNFELLGRIDLEEKKYADSSDDFKRALALKPSDPDLEFELATALAASGKDAQGKAMFEKAASAPASSQAALFARLSLISMDMKEKNYADAHDQAESLYRAEPSNAQMLELLGNIAEKQKKPDQAVDYFRRAEQAQPGDADAAGKAANAEYEQGLALKKSGDKAKAKELLTEASTDADSAKEEKLKEEIQAALQGL